MSSWMVTGTTRWPIAACSTRPIAFSQPIYAQPGFIYTPAYVVSEPAMFGALFVRRGYGGYYFGDYFGAPYSRLGFSAWCGTIGPGGGFAIGFGVGRSWGYDPLWSYYSLAYRNNRPWFNGFNTLYAGRYNGTIAAPPRTLVQQNTVINKITNVNVKNVTNNVTVVNRNVTVNNKDVTAVTMVAPMKVVNHLQPEAKMQPISAQVRKQEAQHAQQIHQVAMERRKIETAALARGPVGKATNNQPQSLKLNVPKEIVTRSQVKDVKKGPPPNPHTNMKIEPKGKGEPTPFPRGKGEPFPKGKYDPNQFPKGKGDPKGKGKDDPKGEHKKKDDHRPPASEPAPLAHLKSAPANPRPIAPGRRFNHVQNPPQPAKLPHATPRSPANQLARDAQGKSAQAHAAREEGWSLDPW